MLFLEVKLEKVDMVVRDLDDDDEENVRLNIECVVKDLNMVHVWYGTCDMRIERFFIRM